MITETRPATPAQQRVRAANLARREAARRRRLDKAAAQLHAAGWTLLMPGAQRWTKPGDAR